MVEILLRTMFDFYISQMDRYLNFKRFWKLPVTFFFFLMQTPAWAVRGCVWQFVTYMFMHATPSHLLFNMLVLWFFAPRLESRWGTARFVRFYFVVGIGAGLFHTALSFLTGYQDIPLLGASGAIYGVMLAYALYYPEETVLLYFVAPIKVKYLMIIMGILVFLGSISQGTGGDPGISHVTHLGGLAVAFVYIRGKDWLGGNRRFPRGGGGRRRVKLRQVDPKRHPDFR
jgi:membrane associated rhomboid family serine protease